MVRHALETLGALTLRVVDEFGKIGIFAAQTTKHIFKPPLRTRLFVKEFYKLGVLSLTIVMISGLVPLAELGNFQSQLKSVTGGAGSYSMSFSHYDPVPSSVQQNLASDFSPRADDD